MHKASAFSIRKEIMNYNEKTKRKILSMLLASAMVVSTFIGIVSGMSLTVYADTWEGNPYESLVNTTTEITFDGKGWYLIKYNSTAVNAGTVT